MTPARVDAMRVLKYAISALDDERMLDQPARDRVLTTAVGALHRELDEARKLKLFNRLGGRA
jgi:uncharacterized protein YlaN (UPF0358 family)